MSPRAPWRKPLNPEARVRLQENKLTTLWTSYLYQIKRAVNQRVFEFSSLDADEILFLISEGRIKGEDHGPSKIQSLLDRLHETTSTCAGWFCLCVPSQDTLRVWAKYIPKEGKPNFRSFTIETFSGEISQLPSDIWGVVLMCHRIHGEFRALPVVLIIKNGEDGPRNVEVISSSEDDPQAFSDLGKLGELVCTHLESALKYEVQEIFS